MNKLNMEQVAMELYGNNYKNVIKKAMGTELNEIQDKLTKKALQVVSDDNDKGIDVKNKMSQVKQDVTHFMNTCRG